MWLTCQNSENKGLVGRRLKKDVAAGLPRHQTPNTLGTWLDKPVTMSFLSNAPEGQRSGFAEEDNPGSAARVRTPNPGSRSLAALVLCFMLSAGFAACRRRQRPLYAVVPKGQSIVFWQAVHAGAGRSASGRRGH